MKAIFKTSLFLFIFFCASAFGQSTTSSSYAIVKIMESSMGAFGSSIDLQIFMTTAKL